MLIVALALVAALVAAVASLGGLLRSQQRAHSRREDLLLNQLLHATGRPWQPAPADDTGRAARDAADAERAARRRRFTARPEQFPAPPDDE